MNRGLRKTVAVSFATLMALSLFGCGGSPAEKQMATETNDAQDMAEAPEAADVQDAAEDAGAADTSESNGPEITVYPMDTDESLVYWGGINGNVSANFNNLGDTEIGKQWQEQTGVTIEYQHPPIGQETEQFNLLIADGNYPDLWMWSWQSYPGGPDKALEDGVILDLTDIIAQYCPNLKAFLDANPDVDKQVKTDSGRYYIFPSIREVACCTCGPMIRADWLEELGLEVPETIDEWHEVLTAFKEKKGATAPITWHYPDKGRTLTYTWGTPQNAFVVDDGVCVYGASKPEYKDFLTTMHQWYEEGLLDPDIFSGGDDLTNTKLTSGRSGATVSWAGGGLQTATSLAQKEDPNFRLVATKWPVLNKGDRAEYANLGNRLHDGSVAIGSTCENPVLAAKVLDYGYSKEGNWMFNYGIEGISFTVEDGEPVYTDEILNNPDGWPISQAMGKYIMACYNGPFVQDWGYQTQYFNLPEAREAMDIWGDTNMEEHLLPPITPTQEEGAEYASIMSDINTYADEMTSKFIMGTEDIETGFDKYIETLNQMGLERATEIQNAALERYQSR